MSLSIVILAAGKSTRFKSRTPKVLHPLGGRPILFHVLEQAAGLSDAPPVLVVGPETEEEIRRAIGDRVRYVCQRERLGTGHAVLQAQPEVDAEVDADANEVLVLYGDMPLLCEATLSRLVAAKRESGAAIAMLTVSRPDPRGFGRVLRNAEGAIAGIVEEVEATPQQRAIRELNAAVYVFDAPFLWEHLDRLEPSPRKGEYYLTDLIEMAVEAGHSVVGVPVADAAEALGINTRADLAVAAAALRQRINARWMAEGVTLIDPATTYVGPEVTIGQDTVIHPHTHLRGATTIGEACEIGPNTIIEACTIGNRCRVLASVLEKAVMEDESDVGPFGHLRKGARLCRGAHMGNFGEVKNSTIGPGAKMGHFSYVGDAEIGAKVNIGAGTITCNYDGERKHRTVIEEGVFIGSDTMLVAPVHIGARAKTGAGSVVTRDIPAGQIVYGVPARPPKREEPPE